MRGVEPTFQNHACKCEEKSASFKLLEHDNVAPMLVAVYERHMQSVLRDTGIGHTQPDKMFVSACAGTDLSHANLTNVVFMPLRPELVNS
jgi:hypothetical protein